MLSPCFGEKPKLHPVAFYSNKFSPAEQNYGIGNYELLAVKPNLEEWCHWLEGAVHQFSSFTDHKNLEYLKTAKCLNLCQACQVLFFTWFHFMLPYRTDSKNTKADSLSCFYSTESPNQGHESILPPTTCKFGQEIANMFPYDSEESHDLRIDYAS